ncbi:MAG: aminoacyl-tRNA hydrolase [Terrimicrobiaceae bacterium]
MENPAAFRLVACLGNPGPQYRNTRHNIGFLVADELARRSVADFSFQSQWNSETAKVGGRTLMKPQTFMNLSGEAVGDFAKYYKIPSEQVLVILDDTALPLGTIRLRKSGTAGGHNGLDSVLVHLGTEKVPRLRVGIGRPGDTALHDHVLGMFEKDEMPAVAESVTRASDAFEFANAHGMDAAMNQFNQRNQEP